MSDDIWTVVRMIEWATGYFENKKVPVPRLSIEWILSDVLKIKRLELYLQFDRPLKQSELDIVRGYVQRRARHEPLQYITGSTQFYNATIHVNPSVLIPRPETEELVELILKDHPSSSKLNVLDIGTGSGCIPIALKLERPDWSLTAIDISKDALETAKSNCDQNKVQVNLLHGDMFDLTTLPKFTWDVIVSNPPYIPLSEHDGLEPQVVEFEPHTALFCKDRSAVYEQIRNYAETSLKPNGHLYLELHENHPIVDENIFPESDWKVTLLKDLGNKNRFLKALRI